GVSGSGKSTLMQDVLHPALARHFGKATETPGAHDRLLGAGWLGGAVFVDQSPIGKTARSNPASYVGAFDEIRKPFAQAPLDREVVRRLQPIVDVGLEYVKLGQPVPTLSGGEAQRLKLAGFLAEAAQNGSASRQGLAKRGTLFMFDEPTTGLHFDDIAKLMRA